MGRMAKNTDLIDDHLEPAGALNLKIACETTQPLVIERREIMLASYNGAGMDDAGWRSEIGYQ